MIFLYLSAVTLSSEKTYRSSSCAATRFQPSCGESHEIIAVESIKHGTKLTCGFQNTSDGCCSYDINDCLLPYTGTTLLAECSGKYVCSGSSPSAIDTSTCVPAQYPVLSHYLTMEYYCLPGKYTFTAAGAVQCGGRKTSPRTSTIVQFILYFSSFEISVNILRKQKK